MRNLEYPIALRPLGKDEGGGRLAEFPDLPGCMADGATPEEAMKEAADAVRSWIKTAKAHGDPIPPPSRASRTGYSGRWVLRIPKSLHKRLSACASIQHLAVKSTAPPGE
jgi:antitoxin HicB